MQSIVSYKDRGHWGKSRWRGNTSGFILKDLFNAIRPRFVVDPMEGSGTTGDVCREMKIKYRGFDLHSGFNALKESLRARLNGETPDHIFLHPPYHDMITYSGSVWGDKHPDDLSRCANPEAR